MRLGEVDATFGIEIVRDGVFSSLGFVSHATPQKLVFLEDEKYASSLSAEGTAAVLTTRALAGHVPSHLGLGVCASPRVTFYRLHNRLCETEFYRASFPTEIAPSAKIHPRAHVDDTSVRIGPGCVVEAGAIILGGTVLVEDVIVRPNAVLGSEGFQFIRDGETLLGITHGGGVLIERGVELQPLSSVDRALFGGYTTVGAYTKIDNRVHVGHNCVLGRRNRVASGVVFSGSVRTGDDVWFGPLAAISNEIVIGSNASISIGAVVTRDVQEGQRVTGNFAVDHGLFLAYVRAMHRLPPIRLG